MLCAPLSMTTMWSTPSSGSGAVSMEAYLSVGCDAVVGMLCSPCFLASTVQGRVMGKKQDRAPQHQHQRQLSSPFPESFLDPELAICQNSQPAIKQSVKNRHILLS